MNAVIYFSASGVTKRQALQLAEKLEAPVFEIQPKVLYTREDLNWMDENSRSSVEMADKSFRPEMMEMDLDVTPFDTIYLGFPIWWYVAPTIINTFLESFDFSGKHILLFATSGGSGFGNTVAELQPSAPNAIIEEWMLNGRHV